MEPTLQAEIARIRIDERVSDADRVRRVKNAHSPRHPRPAAPTPV
jgi:hypothetical protein